MVTNTLKDDVVVHLRTNDIAIVEGPAQRLGAVGKSMLVCFQGPNDSLVEVSTGLP